MGRYSEKQDREVEQIFKTTPSSDCSLELDYMKLELLVMADQPCCREYVPVPLHSPPVKPWELRFFEDSLYGLRRKSVTGVKS